MKDRKPPFHVPTHAVELSSFCTSVGCMHRIEKEGAGGVNQDSAWTRENTRKSFILPLRTLVRSDHGIETSHVKMRGEGQEQRTKISNATNEAIALQASRQVLTDDTTDEIGQSRHLALKGCHQPSASLRGSGGLYACCPPLAQVDGCYCVEHSERVGSDSY